MLAEQLAILRKTRGLTHNDLAKILKVTRQTYSLYESGQHEMSYESIILIADFYGVTVDFLLGRTKTVSTDLLGSDELDLVMKYRSFNRRDQILAKTIFEAIKNT